MTAYSFGNKWMGIIALKESPLGEQEPLHRMAARLNQQQRVGPRFMLSPTLSLDRRHILELMRSAEFKALLRGDNWAVQKYQEREAELRDGSTTNPEDWMKRELNAEFAKKRNAAKHVDEPSDVATGSITALSRISQVPVDEELPALNETLKKWLMNIGLPVSPVAEIWLRWACLHSSYLFESQSLRPLMSARVLSLLEALGNRWLKVALVDSFRDTHEGRYSSAEISKVAASMGQINRALSAKILKIGCAHLGTGEERNLITQPNARSIDAVSFQIVGALCLSLDSFSPAQKIINLFNDIPLGTPDWRTLLVQIAKKDPKFEVEGYGPDHERFYRAKVTIDAKSAVGAAQSKKKAQSDAARNFIQKYHPDVQDPAHHRANMVQKPAGLYSCHLPKHMKCVNNLASIFAVEAKPLISQSLTHSSWTHENQKFVRDAHQQANNSLATEGAFVLDALACHSFTLSHCLKTGNSADDDLIFVAPPKDQIVDLAHAFGLDRGLLLGHTELRNSHDKAKDSIVENALQALIGAVWRVDPGGLLRRRPKHLTDLLETFDSSLDPSTQFERYCSSLQIQFGTSIETRGPDHARENRAIIQLGATEDEDWVGPWRSNKKAAAGAARAELLALIHDFETESLSKPGSNSAVFLGLIIKRVVDTYIATKKLPVRAVARRKLALNDLIEGRIDAFNDCARVHESHFVGDSLFVEQLADLYHFALLNETEARVSRWLVKKGFSLQATSGEISLGPGAKKKPTSSLGSLAALFDMLEATLTAPDEVFTFLEHHLAAGNPHLRSINEHGLREAHLPAGSKQTLMYLIEQSLEVAAHVDSILEISVAQVDQAFDVALRIQGVDLPATLRDLTETAKLLVPSTGITYSETDIIISIPKFSDTNSALTSAAATAFEKVVADQSWFKLHANLEKTLATLQSEHIDESRAGLHE